MSRRIERSDLDIVSKAHAMVRSAERAGASVIHSREAARRIASTLDYAEDLSRREMDQIHSIARQALWDSGKSSNIRIEWEQ